MRILWNGVRLGVTLALGLVAIRLAAGLGPGALPLFLVLMALRQAGLVIPAARESAVIAGGGARRGRTVPTGAAMAAGLSLILPAGPMGLFAIAIWLAAAWWSAPAMAQLLLAGRTGRYNLVIGLRRAGDALVLGLMALMGATGDSAIAAALLLSAGWAWAIALWLPAGPTTTGQAGPGRPGGAFVLLGLSGALILRGPVLLCAGLFGVAGAADLALATSVAAYVRQAGTAILSGLDAAIRRSTDRGTALLRATALQSAGMGTLAFGLGHAAAPVLGLVVGGAPGAGAVVLLPLLAVGLGLRAMTETWTKALGGLGRIALVVRRLVAAALVFVGAVALLLGTLPPDSGPRLVAGLLLLHQLGTIAGLLVRPVARVFGLSPWCLGAVALAGPGGAALALVPGVPVWIVAGLILAPLGVYLRPIIASRISVRSTSAP